MARGKSAFNRHVPHKAAASEPSMGPETTRRVSTVFQQYGTQEISTLIHVTDNISDHTFTTFHPSSPTHQSVESDEHTSELWTSDISIRVYGFLNALNRTFAKKHKNASRSEANVFTYKAPAPNYVDLCAFLITPSCVMLRKT